MRDEISDRRPSGDRSQKRAQRMDHLQAIGRDHGYFRRVGRQHAALWVEEESETLLVSFDTAERVLEKSATGLPLGFDAVQRRQWSLLSVLASRQSWFRDGDLYDFFDALVDDGLFDQFDRVVFTGIGPMCGYGALAFSVAAPGARCLAVNPVASLDRDAAPFETRFRSAWSLDFQGRYGFAPAMIAGADAVTLIYDPANVMCAAHAAMFQESNVARYKLRWGGMGVGAILSVGDTFLNLLNAAAEGPVSPALMSDVLRKARRNSLGHIANVMTQAERKGHDRLALSAAEHGGLLAGDGRFDRAVSLLRSRRSAAAG